MTTYIIRRILISIPVLFAITVLAYGALSLAPGDPLTSRIDPEILAKMTPEQIAAARASLGLDQPVPVRYVIWLGDCPPGQLRLLRREQAARDRRGHRPPPADAAADVRLARHRHVLRDHLRDHRGRPPVLEDRLPAHRLLHGVHRHPELRHRAGADLRVRGRAQDLPDDRNGDARQAVLGPGPRAAHGHAGRPCSPCISRRR